MGAGAAVLPGPIMPPPKMPELEPGLMPELEPEVPPLLFELLELPPGPTMLMPPPTVREPEVPGAVGVLSVPARVG